MASPVNSIPPGQVIGGKYRIGEVLGAGGMGCVYKAANIEIGLKVAIKHLHAEFSTNDEAVMRFRREAKLAASIGHDNICEVIDFGTAEDGTPFLVMPQLRGQSLGDLIENQGTVSPAVIIDIVCQTLSALEAAHLEHIVHRDLKPDNIFITTLGDRENFVKLLDFGISKIIDQDTVSGMTQTGTILGTPYYMAPEQARGKKEIDGRTDIWAVGVILFEALTGVRPFTGQSYNEIMFAICDNPVPSPSALNPSIPPLLEAVILRAVSREPEARFQSAEEMRRALDDIKERLSTTTPRPAVRTATAFANTMVSIAPDAPHKSRKYLKLTAAVLLSFLLLLIAVFGLRKSPAPPSVAAVPAASLSPSVHPVETVVVPKETSLNISAFSAAKGDAEREDSNTDTAAEKTALPTTSKPATSASETKGAARPQAKAKPSQNRKAERSAPVEGRFNTEIDPTYE